MSLDRVKGELADWIRSLFAARLDHLAFYAAKVVSQAADGTLEVLPDERRLPPMRGVPIRLGLPASQVKVSPGARVMVGFENGDPRFPVVAGWGPSTATEIGLAGGAQYVALGQDVRDELDAIWEAIAAHTHPVSGSAALVTATHTLAITILSKKTVKATKVKAT